MSKKREQRKIITLVSATICASEIYHSRLRDILTVLCFCPG